MQPNQQPLTFDNAGNLLLTGIKQPNGNWSIDSSGNSVFQNVSAQSISLGGSDLATLLKKMPQGIVAGTNSPNSTATYDGTYADAPCFCQIVLPNCDHTRQYEVWIFGKYSVGTSTPTFVAVDCYAKAGAPATVNDQFMFSTEWDRGSNSNSTIGPTGQTFTTSSGIDGQNLYLGFFIYASVAGVQYVGTSYGGGWIKDIGQAIPSQTYTPGSNPTQQYTKTYACTFSATYQQNGTNRGLAECYQGYYSGTNGNQWSVIGFPASTIKSDLTGATINSVSLYLHNKFWYYNNGGTAVIGYSSINSGNGNQSYASCTPDIQEKLFSFGASQWVSLPVSVATAFQNGSASSICLGQGPTTSQQYYGYFEGYNDGSHPPQLQITYTK